MGDVKPVIPVGCAVLLVQCNHRAVMLRFIFSLIDSGVDCIANTITVRKHIILLEDLPSILHSKTQDSFHSSLQALVDSPNPRIAPIVIIVSDSGMRGETDDEKRLMGGRTW
jgi:hypothetical protein